MTTTTDRATDRPSMIEELFRFFGCIDYNDRLRQGYLMLEIGWITRCWSLSPPVRVLVWYDSHKFILGTRDGDGITTNGSFGLF